MKPYATSIVVFLILVGACDSPGTLSNGTVDGAIDESIDTGADDGLPIAPSTADIGLEDGGVIDLARVDDSSVDMTVDAVAPDTATPDTFVPDSAMPDSAMPDSAMPDSAMPDSAMPDSAMPDSAMPDTTASADAQQKLATYFRADSLWNTPIANEPVGWYDVPAMRSNCWWINYEAYANPVVFGAPSDPLVDVTVPDSWGWPAGVVQVHVPSGMTGAVGTDGSIVIVSGTKSYDFWQFDRTSNTTATVSAWAQDDIVTGTGWGNPSPFKAAGIRAGGSSGLAGQIMGDELQTGIHHALAIASTPAAGLDGPTRPPAISSDGPAEGLRVGIPPGTAKPSGLSVQGSHVWDALVTYGAWLADRIGGACVIAFNADPLSVPEADVNALYGDLDTIKTHVRVIDYDYPYNP